MATGFDVLAHAGAQAKLQQQQFNENQRVAGRDQFVALQKNILDNPHNDPNDPTLNDIKDPTARQAEVERRTAVRQKATQDIASAYAPHEGGSLVKVLSGLIHGAPAPQNPATTTASQPVSSAAPSAPDDTSGPQVPGAAAPPIVKDALGIPISDPNVAAAHQEPMHPMQTDHPMIGRFHEALDALGSHLKAAGQGFQAKQPVQDTSNVGAYYTSPVETARETASLQAEHAQKLAETKGGFATDVANIRAGGSSAQARYIRAFANEKGKEPSALSPDEMQQAIREYGEANRRPQVIIDQRSGVANIVTRDSEGQAIASPMRDEDGQTFDGFKPDKVSIHNGHYQFIGADNQVHSVPITNVTRTIFGPHVLGVAGTQPEGDTKPLVLHKRDPEAAVTPIASAPSTPPDVAAAAASTAPPSGNGSQRRGAAVKAKPIAAPTTGGYSGTTLGAAKMNAGDRSVLESDQQLTDSVGQVLPLLEKMKDKNSLVDRAKMELAWQQYKHGISPSDPELGEVIRNVALLQIQGAAPWTRIGRSKYTFDVIQKHLPAPTDTPKLLYDKVSWLKNNVIPSSVGATLSPAGIGGGRQQPISSAAPSAPTDRPAGVPPDYVHKDSGPHGPGWYKP